MRPQALIYKLREEEKDIIQMLIFGNSYKEIAKMKNITEENVRQIKSRAMLTPIKFFRLYGK